MIPILAVLLAVTVAASVVLGVMAQRQRARLRALELQAAAQNKRGQELEERVDTKAHQVEELRAQLDRTREEAKKVKKKAYQQQQGKEPTPTATADSDRIQAEALTEARGCTKKAEEEAAAAREECGRLREQVERQKAELTAAQAAAQAAPAVVPQAVLPSIPTQPAEQAKVEQAQAPAAEDRIHKLEAEIVDLNKKLEIARRKSRNDSQIYRVTCSKLELAMEKIQYLEKEKGKGPRRPRAATPPGSSVTALSSPPAPSMLSEPPPVEPTTPNASEPEPPPPSPSSN